MLCKWGHKEFLNRGEAGNTQCDSADEALAIVVGSTVCVGKMASFADAPGARRDLHSEDCHSEGLVWQQEAAINKTQLHPAERHCMDLIRIITCIYYMHGSNSKSFRVPKPGT